MLDRINDTALLSITTKHDSACARFWICAWKMQTLAWLVVQPWRFGQHLLLHLGSSQQGQGTTSNARRQQSRGISRPAFRDLARDEGEWEWVEEGGMEVGLEWKWWLEKAGSRHCWSCWWLLFIQPLQPWSHSWSAFLATLESWTGVVSHTQSERALFGCFQK